MKIFNLILGLFLLAGCSLDSQHQDDDMTSLETKKGWSNSGKLKSGTGAATGIGVSANFTKEPGNYTIQFGLNQPTNLSPGDVIRAQAEITWSVEGNDVRRLVDCVNGMSVSGAGQGVKAVIRDSSITSNPIEYDVSAQIVKGTRPSVTHPPFLTGSPIAVGAPIATIPIPVNAGVTSVSFALKLNNTPLPENSVLVFHVTAGSVILTAYDPRTFQWVPIAAGASQILIQNFFGTPVQMTPIWGIDG